MSDFARRRRRAPAAGPPEHGAAAVDAEPDPEQVARAIVLRLLTGAPRSRAQLAGALAKRDVPQDVATRVLDRFTEVGLIDDAEYARVLVRSRQADRGLSRRALAVELRRRGVDDPTAQQALSQVGDDDEVEAARRLVGRRLAMTRGLDPQVRMRRTLAALGRRGYPAGLVAGLVREALVREREPDDDGPVPDDVWDGPPDE
jgi:regulatory protein